MTVRPGAAALLLATLLASGCTLLPLGGSPSGRPGGALSPIKRGLREYRLAFHCHSLLSHDSEGSFERIAIAASEVGIDVVALNDHYEPGNVGKAPHGIVGETLVLPGVEIRALGGSMLACGLTQDFEKRSDRAELVSAFEKQGGVVALGHIERIEAIEEAPFDFDLIEIFNLHAVFKARSRWSILWRFFLTTPDAFFEAALERPDENIAAWDRVLASGRRVSPVAGCDAHENIRVFGPLGGVLGTYAELMRLVSTHVLAERLESDAILDALRRGRVFVAFDALGDAHGFSVSYGDVREDAAGHATFGEEAPFSDLHTLVVTLPETEEAAELRVLRDGNAFFEARGASVRLALPGPGVYRVEVSLDGRLWILSAPLYITSPLNRSDAERAAPVGSSTLSGD